MKKLIVYSDSAELGGHEIQFLNALSEIVKTFEVTVIASKKNRRFIARLAGYGVSCIETNYTSNRYQFIRSYFSFRQISYLRGILHKCNPDVFLILQGNIELCSVAVVAAARMNVPTVSYIPITHFLLGVGQNSVVGFVKDLINRRMFSQLRHFITINNYNASLIRRRNPSCKISVVGNGVDFAHLINSYGSSNDVLFNEKHRNVLLIGRVLFQQKGQDFLFSMVRKYRYDLRGFRFLICGDGEDLPKLRSMIQSENLDSYFEIIGFSDSPASVYALADTVIIPSRFESGEGTPMVLLEALYLGKNVIMSNLPGVDGYLGENCLFEVGDIDMMFCRIKSARSAGILSKEKLEKMHSANVMAATFSQVLNEI